MTPSKTHTLVRVQGQFVTTSVCLGVTGYLQPLKVRVVDEAQTVVSSWTTTIEVTVVLKYAQVAEGETPSAIVVMVEEVDISIVSWALAKAPRRTAGTARQDLICMSVADFLALGNARRYSMMGPESS